MNTFSQRRKAIHALRRFEPGMEEEDKEVPAGVLLIGFLAFIGTITVIYFIGLAVILVTKA